MESHALRRNSSRLVTTLMTSSFERQRCLFPDHLSFTTSLALKQKIHLTVLEVELVSFQDRKSWFVFEVELDGETQISHHQIKDAVNSSLAILNIFLGDVQSFSGSTQCHETARCPGTRLQQSPVCVLDFQPFNF